MTEKHLRIQIASEMQGSDYLQLMVTKSGLLFRCEAWCISCDFLIVDHADLYDALSPLSRMANDKTPFTYYKAA